MIYLSLSELFFVKNCFLILKSGLNLAILNIYQKVQFLKIMIDMAYTGARSKLQTQKDDFWQDCLQPQS